MMRCRRKKKNGLQVYSMLSVGSNIDLKKNNI